jgi:hypothetical protein
MFHRLISGLQVKSLEHASKIAMPVVDREEIERQTRATIQRIIQHRNEQLQVSNQISPIVNIPVDEAQRRRLRAGSRGYLQHDDQYGFFSNMVEVGDNEGGLIDNEYGENVFDLDL